MISLYIGNSSSQGMYSMFRDHETGIDDIYPSVYDAIADFTNLAFDAINLIIESIPVGREVLITCFEKETN